MRVSMSVVEKTSEVVAADLAVSAVVVRFAGDSGLSLIHI